MNILLTGYTGNLGMEIAKRLAPHHVLALMRRIEPVEGVEPVEGSLENLPVDIVPRVEVIIHSAALTGFRLPEEELRRTNVEGTARLLEFARACPRLQRFIHLSTTCVCGNREGHIAEAPLPERPLFMNHYEASKWEAEQVVLASSLPVEIVRISTVAGSERAGDVRRPGALHQTLYWLYKGLIPMVPAHGDSRVDLISTEFAAASIAELLNQKVMPGRVAHVAAGERAPGFGELMDFLVNVFAQHHQGWARGSVSRPDMVDATTFALFEESVRQSGDVLFRRVCEDAQSFLPGLLHKRTLATSSLTGSIPMADWRVLAERVFNWLLLNDWGRKVAYATT